MNESFFCDWETKFLRRFSFYGLRGILELYFVNDLQFTPNQATMTLHGFVFFSYFFSLPGGYLSDVYLGIACASVSHMTDMTQTEGREI